MKVEMSEQEVDIQNKKIEQLEELINLIRINLDCNLIVTKIFMKVALKGNQISQEEYDLVISSLNELRRGI